MLQLKSLNNELMDLKIAFDNAIIHGDSFADVKKIYTEIKELEKRIAEREISLLKAGKLEG